MTAELVDRTDAPAGTVAGAERGRLPGWLPAAVAVVAVAAMLAMTGTAPWDIVRYAGYLAWAIVLPGTLLYRLARRTPHSLVDDLAMGAVLGLALEIAAYSLFGALGLLDWLIAWPLAVVLPFLLVPRLRRHWRSPVSRPVSSGWAWTVAAIVVGFAAYTAVAALAGYPPVPSGSGTWYVIDQPYMLSLTAELKHHFPPHLPQLAGEPLNYHWFAYAHEAVASRISGVDTPVVAFRLAPLTLSAAAPLLLAVAGWRVCGDRWVGAIAAALTFSLGETVSGTLAPYLGSAATFVWTSHSAIYSWLAGYALIPVIGDALRAGGLPGGRVGAGRWPLMAAFALLAVGGKASVLPVVLAGVVLVGLVGLVGRGRLIDRILLRQKAVWAVGAVLVAATGFGTVVLYRFESHGLALDPLLTLRSALPPLDGAPATKQAALLAIGLAAYAVYQCARLAGIPVLAWLAGRRGRDDRPGWGAVEWFLLGAAGAAIGATLLLGHPSTSQLYFLRTGFGFGAILSAAGYRALVRPRCTSNRTLTLIIGCAATSTAIAAVLDAFPGAIQRFPGARALGMTAQIVVPAVAFALAGGVVAAGWLLARRRVPALRGYGALVALTAVLVSGVYGLVDDARWAHGWLPRAHPWHTLVTGDQVAAAGWLRAHSAPDDLVATNRHYGHPANTTPLGFALEAYAERRLLVGAWGYVPEAVSRSRDLGVNPSRVPFWEPDLLAVNDAVFTRPDPAAVQRLRGYGVRWLIADGDAGPVSPELDRYAVLRYVSGPVWVYRLP